MEKTLQKEKIATILLLKSDFYSKSIKKQMLNIEIENISYGKKEILKDIKIDISKNGLYGFFGKNASGKTTFLNAVCGLIPYKGRVSLNEKNISERKIAFIPTEPFLYEYLTINEFYKFYSFTVKDMPKKSKYIFDIDDDKILKNCSTGTKKKAFINTVCQFEDYDIYIFDEPFNGLDIESNYILLNEIVNLSKNNIVFISSHIVEIIEPYLTESFFVNEMKVEKINENSKIKTLFTIND